LTTAHKFGGALESPSKINCSGYKIGQYVLLQSVDIDYRSVDILNELKLPNLNVRRHNQLFNKMYKVNNNEVPDYLVNLFTKTSSYLIKMATKQRAFKRSAQALNVSNTSTPIKATQ
jgi:hypothetical protein